MTFEKFGVKERKNFYDLDQYVDEYHVISEITKKQLSGLTEKKISSLPFWVNQNKWFEINEKIELRNAFNLSKQDYLIGSFQRIQRAMTLSPQNLAKVLIFL